MMAGVTRLVVFLAFLAPMCGPLCGPLCGPVCAALPLPAPSPAPYVEMGRRALAELPDLRLERPLARTAVLEVVGGLAFGLTDEISLVLRALRIDLEPRVAQVPVRWLLQRLNLRGLDGTGVAALLERGPPEAAARASMVLEGCRLGADAMVGAADELLVGICQLVRVVMKGVLTIEKLSARIETVPGAGRAARAIRRAVVKRLLRALDSVVYLATRPLRQPLRSRLRAASALVSLVLYKWDDAAVGLPGPAAVAVLLGKAYVLGSARFGAFARLQRSLDAAVERAGMRAPGGTLAEAAACALSAPEGAKAPGILDAVLEEARRRSRLSGVERQSAKLAGVASDVATLLAVADPTGVARVVAAVARALQGGLVLHATFLSASMLHRIPREVSRMVDAAFDPGRASDASAVRTRALSVDPALALRGQRVEVAVDGLLESLGEAGALDRLEPRIAELEAASDGCVGPVRARSAAALAAWGRGTPEAALLEHDLAAAALLAGCLDAPSGKAAGPPRRLAEAADAVRRSAALLAAPAAKAGDVAEDEGVALVIEAPEAARPGEALDVRVRNVGATPATGVEVQVSGGAPAAVGDLAPDAAAPVAVTATGAALLILARDRSGAEAARTIWVRP